MTRQVPTMPEEAQVSNDFETFFLPFDASLDLSGAVDGTPRTVYGVTDPAIDLSIVNVRHLRAGNVFRGIWTGSPVDVEDTAVSVPYRTGQVVVGSNDVLYRLTTMDGSMDPVGDTTNWQALGVVVTPGVQANSESTPPTPPGLVQSGATLSFRGYYGGAGVTIDNATGEIRASNFSLTDIRQFDTFAQLLAVDDNEWHIGDIGIITGGMNPLDATDDGEGTYVYIGSTSGNDHTGTTVTDDWRLLRVPHGVIQMVAGHPGPVVTSEQIADAIDSLIDLGELGNVTQTPGVMPGQHLIYSADADGQGNPGWTNHAAGSTALLLQNLANVESTAPTPTDRVLVWDPMANSGAGEWQPSALAQLNIRGYTYDALTALTVNGLPSSGLEDSIPKIFTGDADPVLSTTGVSGFNGEGVRHRGDFYINTTDDTLWFFDGTMWAEVGASIDDLNEVGNVVYEGMGSHSTVTRYTQLLDSGSPPDQVVTESFSNFGTPRISINADGNTVITTEPITGALQYDAVDDSDPRIPFDLTADYVVFVEPGQTPSDTNRVTTTIPYRLIAVGTNTITIQGSVPRAMWTDTTTTKGLDTANVFVSPGATTVAARPTQGQILTWNATLRDSEGNLGVWTNEDPEHIMANQNLHDLQDVDNNVAGNEMLLRNTENDLWESIPIADDDASIRTVARQINLEHLADVNETQITMTAVFSPVNNREGSIEEINIVTRNSQQDSIRHGTDSTDRPLDVTMLNANDDVVWFSTLSEGFTGTQGTNGVDRFGPFTIEEVVTTPTASFIRVATLASRTAINAGTFYAWTSRDVPMGGIREGDVLGWIGDATNGSWQNVPVANLAFSSTNLDAFDDVTYDDDVFQTIFSVALAEDTRSATNMVTLNTPTTNDATGNQESTLFANRDLDINFEAGDFSAGDQVYFSAVTPPVGQSFTRRGPYTVDRVVNNNPVFIIGSGAGQIAAVDRGNINGTSSYAYIAVPSSTTVRPGDVLVRSADGSTWVNETPDQMAANPNGGIQLQSLRDVNRVHEQEEVLTPTPTGVTVTSATLNNAASMRLVISANISPAPAVGSLLRFAGRTEVFDVLSYTPNFDVAMRDSSLIPQAFVDGLGTDNPEISTLVSSMRDIPLADNEILAYNNTDDTWRNQTPGEAGLVSQINLFNASTMALRPTADNNGSIDLPLATDMVPGLMSSQDVRTIEEFPDEAPTSTDGMTRTNSNTIMQGGSQDFALRVTRRTGNDGLNADDSDSYQRTWTPVIPDDAGVEEIRLEGDTADLSIGTQGRVTIPLADSSTTGVINSGNYDRLVSLPQTPTTTDGTSGGTMIADGANQEFGLQVSRSGANFNQVWVPLTEQDRLEFTEDQSTATLTGYRNEAGVLETVQDTDMVSYDSTNPNRQRLQLTLASFPMTPAAGFSPVTLDWDQPYGMAQSQVGTTQIGVSANNPTDFTSQYLDELTVVTADSGNTGIMLSSFTGSPNVMPAGGVPWFQRLTLNTGQFLRDSNTGLTGGVTTVMYTLTDNLDNTHMASQTFTWDTPTVTTRFNDYTTRPFWQRQTTAVYTTTLGGMANGDNISTNWTQSDTAFSNLTTALGTNSPGFSFANRNLTFTTPFYHGLGSQGSITATSVFSRPADVTGSAYTAQATSSIAVPSPSFSMPNLTRFVTNMDALTVDDFLTGDFNTGLGLDYATGASSTFTIDPGDGTTENNYTFTGANRFYWFGFPQAEAGITFTDVASNLEVAQQPSQMVVFSAANLNGASGISNVPTGLTTETYHFYGILLNAGTNRIRITL